MVWWQGPQCIANALTSSLDWFGSVRFGFGLAFSPGFAWLSQKRCKFASWRRSQRWFLVFFKFYIFFSPFFFGKLWHTVYWTLAGVLSWAPFIITILILFVIIALRGARDFLHRRHLNIYLLFVGVGVGSELSAAGALVEFLVCWPCLPAIVIGRRSKQVALCICISVSISLGPKSRSKCWEQIFEVRRLRVC